MKPLLIILSLLGLGGTVFSQNFTYYRPGQAIPAGTEAGLLVRSNAKSTKHLATFTEQYKEVKALKLVDFDGSESNLDSTLQLLSRLPQLQLLVFENCDLTALETPLNNFAKLQELQLLKGCMVDENMLFPLLKHTGVKRIAFQTEDPDLVLDSLSLLSQLQSLSVSNTGSFGSSNLKQRIPVGGPGNKRLIDVDYFGRFYKQTDASGNPIRQVNEPTGPAIGPRPDTQQYQSKLACIRQPIPGIRINDTIYRIDSRKTAVVNYQSGTQLTIPSSVFLTAEGKLYNGEVTLFYREFRDPVEIMLSGIPMTVIEQGDTNLFKSGGMYDIQAYDLNNKPLTTTSDTAIGLRFAMTDTSRSFKFYNLNNNGSWNTLSNTVTTLPGAISKDSLLTKAIIQYYKTYQAMKNIPDTTKYEARFESKDYLYWYRRDTPDQSADKRDPSPGYSNFNDAKRHRPVAAIFKVKYVRQTKDKELVFMLVPAKSYVKVPDYMKSLMNKTFLYAGTLSKAEFKQTFSKYLLCWDLRVTANGGILDMNIKTTAGFVALAGQVINLKDDRSYTIMKQGAATLERHVNNGLRHEARDFNKLKKDKHDTRFDYRHNDLNSSQMGHRDNYAYKASQPLQNTKEQAMTQKEFIAYAGPIYSRTVGNNSWNLEGTAVGQAMLKSGLGVKNIDEYIHKGQMQQFYVRYNNTDEAVLASQNNYMLFKSINTVYPLNAYMKEGALSGYYFKGHRNYVIRFSEEAMQITKPDELNQRKVNNKANLDYITQYDVKGMDSNGIKQLIFQ